ncbi:hypothetical protein LTR70_003607 [Exophiala xenobiotica]|uniref:DUF171-domain-containing protein n=1 Tax=Lithohypha guttulata TaxID=1690604 RepID=A0ABR0KG18_9EURO|nr:hypothetical protein LTR24_003202 [Lithohypha guttulata]KAK5322820.1 hypothetical protein LTR70_003607 [Exophiala xenobiotica]
MNNKRTNNGDMDTTRPTALYTPTTPRSHTVTVAIPASIIHNSKRKLELRTQLAGTVARALAVFCVDEIVIFDDGDCDPIQEDNTPSSHRYPDPDSSKFTAFSHPGHFLAMILSYLETPPFMRNRLFPMHENLAKAGLLASLDLPSHLRATEWCEYREGVTVRTAREGTYVDCGLQQHRLVRDVEIPAGTRVTLRLDDRDSKVADAVGPTMPREEGGYYWGYTVREAPSLSAVFTECPWEGGYDLSIGTSERGEEVNKAVDRILEDEERSKWKHLAVVFGGVKGLEEAAKNDEELVRMGIAKGSVKELFDYWVNLLPGQGSRTIRTEEALWMGLMATRKLVDER